MHGLTPRKSMSLLRAILPAALATAWLTGCASTGERANRDEWDAIREARPADDTELEAQLPELSESSSLPDYLTYAALNNPGLEAAFNRWKAALEKIPQVRALPDPRFTYGYFIQSVETRVGPQEHKFALWQTFPWFGKLGLRGDKALGTARAQQARYEAAKLDLFYRVTTAYEELYYLGRSIQISEDNVRLLTYFEEVARTQYTTGAASHAAVIKAQVELGKLEDRLRTLQDLLRPAKANLNAALNRATHTPLPVPTVLPEVSMSVAEEELQAVLKEQNPALLATTHLAAGEEASIALARKSYFPDFTLGADYVVTGQARAPNVPDSGQDAFVGLVSINLPIWIGRYGAETREAKARYAAAMDAQYELENRLMADLQMAFYEYRDAERKIDLYKNTLLPKARQSLNVAKEAFTAGKDGFLDLIDAQRTLLEFELSYERALADRAQRLARIETLVGQSLSEKDGNRNDQ